MKLLIVHALPGPLKEALDKRKDEFSYFELPENCYFSVTSEGSNIWVSNVCLNLKDFDLVWIGDKNYPKDEYIEEMARMNNIPVFRNRRGLALAADKFKQYQLYSEKGLPIPKTIFATKLFTEEQFQNLKTILGPTPWLIKPNDRSLGIGVALIDNLKELNSHIIRNQRGLLIQEYINPTIRKDERHIVVGDRVVLSEYRKAAEGKVATNIHAGGTAEPLVCKKDAEDISVTAYKAIGLDYGGVDIIRNDAGDPFILETNGHPLYGIIDVNQHNFFDDILDYVKETYSK